MDAQLKQTLQHAIEQHQLPPHFIDMTRQWLLPLAETIAQKQQAGKTLLVSFNGAQGSGKSTLTAFLQILLQRHCHVEAVTVSIDDFYLTRVQRQALAQTVHPLFVTRGVPGTHDVALARRTLQALMQCDKQHPCTQPQFDKAQDDRSAEASWPQIDHPVDVILFEGWCNHAPVQTPQQLRRPINELERLEDPQAIWRSYANEQLKRYHKELFALCDLLVFLKIPAFEKVYQWRGLQERKLGSNINDRHQAMMNEADLRRFIQHYERITRASLQTLPQTADLVLSLNDAHEIESMHSRL